jgi:hypothetical protein
MPSSAIMTPMRVRLRSLGLAAVALVWVVPLGACTDDSEKPPEPDDGPDRVALELSLGPGAEGLGTEARDDLQNDVGAVLSTYVVEGFLGDYPREDFVSVLDSFTTGLAPRAAQNLEQITGASFADAEKVVATRLQARISAFVPGREALGVSAAVDFAFEVTEGGTTREATLRGRLMLEPENGDWKIFGYDVEPIEPPTGGTS